MEWRAGVVGRLSMMVKVSYQMNLHPVEGQLQVWQVWRLHLMGGKMMFWDTVGVSHHRVILIEAPHAIHFIVDAAGDVLNVLHMGPKRNTHIHSHKKPAEETDKPPHFMIIS